MSKMNIAVVGGGNSGEYNISIQSSHRVADILDREKYNVFLIAIKGRNWEYIDETNKCFPVDFSDFSLNIEGRKVKFDVVFNAIHGTPGEDGKLQGYFEMLGIKHTSCNSITSAVTFNKYFCNRLVSTLGVSISPSIHLFRGQEIRLEEILNALKLPVFVKPSCGGSSVGMSKVTKPKDLRPAIELAFEHDTEVLIEQFISGREITCGVYREKGRPKSLPLMEIVSKKEFFDYEAKYNSDLAEEILPAPIDEHLAEVCQSLSERLYLNLGCRGVVRFDYILSNDQFWFLEVNTVPGMTTASIVPKMAIKAGFQLSEFYDLLIEEALRV